jgi:D-glycero-alpha-D-manno-heptose-7-phosphate kinase
MHDTAIIRSAAPIRICDHGGWTDTWFAQHGCVFTLAVHPCVDVELRACEASDTGVGPRVIIHAENFGPPYVRDLRKSTWDQHPLIEAALEALADGACSYQVNIFSAAPPGASVGSSAATAVALLAAIEAMSSPTAADAGALAAAAHRLETTRLGQQSGVQDQLAAAYGGACFIDIDRYPDARVTRLPMPDALRWELDARLALVYLGRAHTSSTVHERVIRGLADRGPDAAPLRALRAAAIAARDAFVAGDLAAFGRAMQANTVAQAELHPALVGPDAQRVIDIARAYGALGWKVNGAGGDGGSLTILGGPAQAARRAMLGEIEAENRACQIIPIRISTEGVRVWRVKASPAASPFGPPSASMEIV